MESADASGLDAGRPGASARAEFERRVRADAARRKKRYGRIVGPIAGLLVGVRPPTARWRIGGEAEERVGRYLSTSVGGRGIVLHDRAITGRQSNIDHLVVVSTGVWVIDTKRYRGRVRRGRSRGRWSRRRTLVVNGHERSELLSSARRQRAVVQAVVGCGVPVRAVLCFTGAEWGSGASTFTVGGVLVTHPARLARVLRARGSVGPADRRAVAARLAHAFPPFPP